MLFQLPITLVRQQHRRRTSFVTGRHIINRIAHLSFTLNKLCAPRLNTVAVRHTIINPSPPSSNSHVLAICRMPAGSGFGGLNSLVTMGANVLPGRNVCSRCITGPLVTILALKSSRGRVSKASYSKFRVHNPIRTPLLSRYAISSCKPGCGSCSTIAAVSMARMAAWACSWAG